MWGGARPRCTPAGERKRVRGRESGGEGERERKIERERGRGVGGGEGGRERDARQQVRAAQNHPPTGVRFVFALCA